MSPRRCCLSCLAICVLFCTIIYFTFELPHIDSISVISRGLELHEELFQWHTSLHGRYCRTFSNETEAAIRKHYSMYNKYVDKEEALQRVFLSSYPRSGNHWTRAVLECLLQTPTYGYRRENHSIYLERVTNPHLAYARATRQHPFIRKYHNVDHINSRFFRHPVALIFLIRDPVESIPSELKHRPYFWKQYEKEMEKMLNLTSFYVHWKQEETKLLLFYEDYFIGSERWLNLRKIQSFFGKEIISDKQMDFCIDNFENVTNMALDALERTAESSANLHLYRNLYFGKTPSLWPVITVPMLEFEEVFSKYQNFESC